MVRNALFRRVELFARRRWYDLGELDAGSGWTAERWEEVVDAYFAEHDDVGTGADARGPALLIIDRQPGVWRVRQILDDPAGDHDWGFDVEVDLEASDVIDAYFDEHDDVGIGAEARGPALLIIDRQRDVWRVRQILDDPAGDHDWGFDVEVDLEASDEAGAAVLRMVDAGRKD